jgi:hypothetical protein
LINNDDKKKQRFDVNIQNLLSALFSAAADSHNWLTIVSVKGTKSAIFDLFDYREMLKFHQ